MTDTTITEIVSRFRTDGEMVNAKPFGSGHINDTYRVITYTGHQYLLQRINHYVFKDVPGLMNNLALVTNHLKNKLSSVPGADTEKEVLTPIETTDNDYFIKDAGENYWRVFKFLTGTKSYDEVTTETQAFEGAKAFGQFQALLSDMDTGLLIDTIPNFHNIAYRLGNLDKAIKADSSNRLVDISPEVKFINERRGQMSAILEMGRQGILPLRITHNDTKFNNVLLDENDHAQCVIDLDTVMPGYVAYDFGDAIRTIINTAPEDEPDLELIGLKIPLFKAYTEGYLEQTIDFLTEAEVSSLLTGALLLPYMQGVRFLTDYLDGDVYFKIHSPQHNLQRARAQFQLVRKLEEAKDELNEIILTTWRKLKNANER